MKQYSDMANFTRLSKPTWKAKLRAWLIDLVREAVALEISQYAISAGPTTKWQVSDAIIPKGKAAVIAAIPIELSFEQMQAEALKAQEKYYEPVKN
jgi:hypothetical protein